jgi:hypothetical protein
MTRPNRFHIPLGAMVVLAVMTGISTAQAADTTGAPAAQWVQRKLDFTYMGFTSKYTCDGLQDNVRDLLLALGARKRDLQIQSTGCTRGLGVEPFPGVRAQFWVLEPVSADEAAKGGTNLVQATQWHTVNLVHNANYRSGDDQCELLDQLKRQALPLFTNRNLNFHSACVPHEITLGDIQFSVDVLRAAPTPPPA